MSYTVNQCRHRQIKQRFCLRCGVYIETSMGVYGIKNSFLNVQSIYSHQIIDNLRINEFDLSRNKDYFSLPSQLLSTFTFINQICTQQLQAGHQTKILACYVFWHSLSKSKEIDQKDIFLAIFIAIKYQEDMIAKKDYGKVRERVISRIFASGEITEKQLMYEVMLKLQRINFRLKLVTFVDFLEFYMVSGVMFSNELKNLSDYNKLLTHINCEIQRYMHNGLYFTQPNQEYLALKILYWAREKCGGIDQIWNWHIEYITKTKKEMIDRIISERRALFLLREEEYLTKENVASGINSRKIGHGEKESVGQNLRRQSFTGGRIESRRIEVTSKNYLLGSRIVIR